MKENRKRPTRTEMKVRLMKTTSMTPLRPGRTTKIKKIGQAHLEFTNLSPTKNVIYSYIAVPVALLNDVPPLKDELQSTIKNERMKAIVGEVETLKSASTFTTFDRPKHGERILHTSIILKLKNGQNVRPVIYKARIVTRENL